MDDPASLIGHAHGRLLRLLSDRAGVHFQGLQQATRCFAYRSFPDKFKKKLVNIDMAFSVVRHIATVSVEEFLVAAEGWCNSQIDDPSTSSTPEVHKFKEAPKDEKFQDMCAGEPRDAPPAGAGQGARGGGEVFESYGRLDVFGKALLYDDHTAQAPQDQSVGMRIDCSHVVDEEIRYGTERKFNGDQGKLEECVKLCERINSPFGTTAVLVQKMLKPDVEYLPAGGGTLHDGRLLRAGCDGSEAPEAPLPPFRFLPNRHCPPCFESVGGARVGTHKRWCA